MLNLHNTCIEMAIRDLRVENESDYRAYQEYPAFRILKNTPYAVFKERYAQTRNDLYERMERDMHRTIKES